MLKITKLTEKQNVYDLTVEDNHNFYANEILVHNCCEVVLPTSPIKSIYDIDNKKETEHLSEGEIALCVLAAFNMGTIKSWEELEEVAEYIIRLEDFVIDHQEYPINAAKKMLKRRSLAVGVTNMAYWMAKNNFKYSDDSSLEAVDEWFEHMQFYLIKASNKLAKEKGPCEWFHESSYSKGILPIDRYNKNVDKLVKRKHSLPWEQLRKDILTWGLRNSCFSGIMPAESSAVVQNSTSGMDGLRSLVTSKKSKSGIVKQVAPEITRLKNKYELVFDMPNNTGYTNIMAVIQKWIDQSISANHWYNSSADGISLAGVIKDILYAYQLGLKTLYYANTNDNRDNEATKESADACESGACSI